MALIDRHPDTRLIIDHLGILQPRVPPAPQEPWADLPKVLDLARRANAVIKVSGACTLSREPYPFPDIWDPLARVFDAWGFDRCLWGTDWTRAFAVVNYEQAVEPFLKTDPPERHRAGHADGRRLRQSLWLVTEEGRRRLINHVAGRAGWSRRRNPPSWRLIMADHDPPYEPAFARTTPWKYPDSVFKQRAPSLRAQARQSRAFANRPCRMTNWRTGLYFGRVQ